MSAGADAPAELRAAFEAFYEYYFPRVYALALRRVRDVSEAQAVTQDVLVRIATADPGSSDPGSTGEATNTLPELMLDRGLPARVLRLTLARILAPGDWAGEPTPVPHRTITRSR